MLVAADPLMLGVLNGELRVGPTRPPDGGEQCLAFPVVLWPRSLPGCSSAGVDTAWVRPFTCSLCCSRLGSLHAGFCACLEESASTARKASRRVGSRRSRAPQPPSLFWAPFPGERGV